ncbi:MAG: NUDIX domain-containing protein [Bacilli bacterium]|nr:NUDIX domain-containing protein [Bacilli bacterium]
MEYLDVYDENKNYIGKYERSYVHENALWHNTVHCWIFDKNGNVYFQIRKEEEKFYTTASGHVISGEQIAEAFGREIKEEIGIDIDYKKAIPVNVYIFKMDKVKADGSVFKDRAFSNVFVYKFDGKVEDFKFDLSEIKGLVKVNAKQVIQLIEKKVETILAEVIENINGKNIVVSKEVSLKNFLVNQNETPMGKYGDILNKVIELTNN